MADIDFIQQLMQAMNENGMNKLQIKEKDGSEVLIEKGVVSASMPMVPSQSAALPTSNGQGAQGSSSGEVEPASGHVVSSPMVGTFYASPSPEDPPFVKVGDHVSADTVVCIVEAMKVMNEVKAGVSGVVKEIMTENAHAVEFGTPLFRIET